MHIVNPLSFDQVRIILAEVHETVTLTAIINEGISASLPVRLVTERSKLAEWLHRLSSNYNIVTLFSQKTYEKIMTEVMSTSKLSEPLCDMCFHFYMRLGSCHQENLANLLVDAYKSTVGDNSYHVFDLYTQDFIGDELKDRGMYTFILLMAVVGVHNDVYTADWSLRVTRSVHVGLFAARKFAARCLISSRLSAAVASVVNT